MLRAETWNHLHDPEADSLDCRRLIVDDFNSATGRSARWDDLSAEEQTDVVLWLRTDASNLDFIYKSPRLAQSYFDSLEAKVAWHLQRPCGSCRTEFPVRLLPVRFRTFSAQNAEAKIVRAFRAAFAEQHGRGEDVTRGPVCVRLLFLLDARRPRQLDLDNLAKGVLDAAKDVLFEDDTEIAHLEAIKFASHSDTDCFFLRVAPTRIGSLDDVIRTTYRGVLAVNELDLTPFLDEEVE